MAVTNLIEIKRQSLTKRLNLLIERYSAVTSQLISSLNEADKPPLKNQLKQIDLEMDEVNQALVALDQTTPIVGAPHQRRRWEEKLPQINFRQAWQQFERIFYNYLEGSAGGAVLFLLPDYETMCANLLVRRMRAWLQEQIGYTKVRHVPLEILEHNQLTSEQLLKRLGSHFNCILLKGDPSIPEARQIKDHTSDLIAKMCNSLERDQVLLIEMTVVPELYHAEAFLVWFLDEFWSPLVCRLAEAVREQNRPAMKCILAVAADQPLPPGRPLPERYCLAEAFGDDQRGQFVPLPLTNWSEEELFLWLLRHSGVDQQWDGPKLQETARAIYARSREGIPMRARSQLEAILTELKI